MWGAIYKYKVYYINVGRHQSWACGPSVFIYFSYIDYFICFHIFFLFVYLLDFVRNIFNINVVIIICIFPPGANFLGELWSCDIGTL